MDTRILEEFGLSNAEVRIYLALLKSGASKTGRIISESKLQSSTVYHIIGSLIKKGFVNFVYKGKIKYFQAENPETFLHFLEEKKRKFLEILPELKEINKESKENQAAKVYQGIKGLHAAYFDILDTMKKGEEYYFIQIEDSKIGTEKFFTFFRNYHLKREEKGIKVKAICHKKSRKTINRLFSGIKNSDIRYYNENIPTGLVIYKNKVITIDTSENIIAVTIESDSISDSYKKFFEERWKKASY